MLQHHTIQYVLQQIRWVLLVTKELLLAMGIGAQWICMTIRIFLFGALVTPFFIPSVLWYIMSPTVIRRVSYRLSPTRRKRNLKSLLQEARRDAQRASSSEPSCVAKEGVCCPSQQKGSRKVRPPPIELPPQETDPVASAAEGAGSHGSSSGSHDASPGNVVVVRTLSCMSLWGRLRFFVRHRPPKTATTPLAADNVKRRHQHHPHSSSCSSSSGNSSSSETDGDITDFDKSSETRSQRGASPAPGGECSRCFSSVLSTTSSSSSSSDSEDEEDLNNLHNRATLDIYMPCAVDELLKVQTKLGVHLPAHSRRSPPPPTAAAGQTPSTSLQRTLSALFEASPPASPAKAHPTRAAAAACDDDEAVTVKKYPIAILISGGAWIIGSHFWSALLARHLSANGFLVFCPDYRNFPQSRMGEMTRDVSDAIAWVLRNADRYHGDLCDVTVVGQSAGAHLAWMSLISQAQVVAARGTSHGPQAGRGTPPQWLNSINGTALAGEGSLLPPPSEALWVRDHRCSTTTTNNLGEVTAAAAADDHCSTIDGDRGEASHIANATMLLQTKQQVYQVYRYDPKAVRHFVALSGIYDLPHLLRHFHQRGLYRKVLYQIAGGKSRLRHEFCINRYFEVAAASAQQCGNDSVQPMTRESGNTSPMAQSPIPLSGTLRRAIARAEFHASKQEAWSLQRMLLNDSIFDTSLNDMTKIAGGGAMSDHHHFAEAPVDSCRPEAFLSHLPRRITLMHGDSDCSAPFSEATKLYQRIIEARKAALSSGSLNHPLQLDLVGIVRGTHTNVIVEELLCGRGCVVRWLLNQRDKERRHAAEASRKARSSGVACDGTASTPKATDANSSTIRMAVPSKRQSWLLRAASFVSPF